jgi:hypothetical protein
LGSVNFAGIGKFPTTDEVVTAAKAHGLAA